MLVNKVENSFDILNNIVGIYENECVNTLDVTRKEVSKLFSVLLKTHSEKYGLSYKNSVHEGVYYEIIDRIKTPKSLKEKFIRKSELLKLIDVLEINQMRDIDQKKRQIIEYLKRYDDIVGIKILTETETDSINVYKLLQNHKQDLVGLQFKDFEYQPKLMKNGLKIFNIKCVYKDEYGIELQIKNRFESAWGDMDHKIFYKNYDYTAIKDATKITMNHVGNLLGEIDKLLFSIRTANKNYEIQEKEIKFLEEIHKKFGKEILELIKVPYEFGLISELLLFIYKSTFHEEYTIKSDIPKNVERNFLKYDIESDKHELLSYKNIRNSSYDIIVLEHLYMQWHFGDKVISNEDYCSAIENFVYEIFVDYLVANLDNGEENKVLIKSVTPTLIKYSPLPEAFLSIKDHRLIMKYRNILGDLEVEEENQLNSLLIMFGVMLFNKSISKECILECADYLDEPLDFILHTFSKIDEHILSIKPDNEDYMKINEINKGIMRIIKEGGLLI